MTEIGRKLVFAKKLPYVFLTYSYLLLTWVLPQLKRWKAWARKTLPQEGRRMRSRILTNDEENTTGQRNTEEDVFLRIGSICICIFKPVHSISRLKITDTVVLLWWIMKLQIFWNQVFRVGFWKATHLYLVNLHNAYVLRKAIWWIIIE